MALHVLLETDFEEGEEFIAVFGGELHGRVLLHKGTKGILLQIGSGTERQKSSFNAE